MKKTIKPNVSLIKGFCTETNASSCGIVIFGASGDLTHKKLIPSLYNLYEKNSIKDDFFIIGCARTKLSNENFKDKIKKSLLKNNKNLNSTKLNEFIKKCRYISGEYDDMKLYEQLENLINALCKKYPISTNLIFYMAIPPTLFLPVSINLESKGLLEEKNNTFRHVIYEKPYGRDLDSALDLDKKLHLLLKENQIYRIDHYLGKETVQNILIFRFANSIFEPIWNQKYIDNVQITVAESIGIEERAGYYDSAGQLRDMFQNHMMQMLSLIAIEPPASFNADRISDEKSKLLRAIQPFEFKDSKKTYIIRGQYTDGEINGKKVPAYKDEKNISKNSNTDTFVAAKIMINNWRWKGVPFYLRTGKRMPKKFSQIAITFKKIPHSMFYPIPEEDLSQNVLLLNIQPDEGISFVIQAKVPGSKVCISTISLDFLYKDLFGETQPEPYERLLLDCMLGDQTLFWRNDGIELSWSLLSPVLNYSEKYPKKIPLAYYNAGTWGPKEADLLLKNTNHKWIIN